VLFRARSLLQFANMFLTVAAFSASRSEPCIIEIPDVGKGHIKDRFEDKVGKIKF